MFYQSLMNEEEKALQQEVRKFVRDEVSHDFIRAPIATKSSIPGNMSRTWPRTTC